MTERKDELRKAAEAAERFDMSSVEEAFSEITLSPLGILIESLLPTVADGDMRTILERIKSLKSGTFEDLLDPQFQSFLISYLRTDLVLLQRITQALRTQQQLVNGCDADEMLPIAARGGDAQCLSGAELRALLARRRFH